jgi:hypothetical protein
MKPASTSFYQNSTDGVNSIPELRKFVKGIRDYEARQRFAESCGTTLGHLYNVMYGRRPSSAKLAVLIEQRTGGAVNRFVLHRCDWHEIWPELIGSSGAPDVPASAEETA